MDSFTAVCYETSVYQKIVELKKDSLTSKGYIDLAQLEGLYVEGAGHFLRNLRSKESTFTKSNCQNRKWASNLRISLGKE